MPSIVLRSRSRQAIDYSYIHSGFNRIFVTVSEKPEEAGVDSGNLLIDADMDDNVKQVKEI
jgi:hypothetical protein